MKNSQQAAFPLLVTVRDGFLEPVFNVGLTKREYFAAMAMQGLCANPKYGDMEYNTIARESVAAADWLLKRLSDNNV